MTQRGRELNFSKKPVVACIHLLPTPGAPLYGGSVAQIYDTALSEAELLLKHGVDGLLIENFRDKPFYPDTVPPETIATIAGVGREIVKLASAVPVGVAVLRNDAEAALGIAVSIDASFIRVNVHVGAVLAAQGMVKGNSHQTLRSRARLRSEVAIYADVAVKHSNPFVYKSISQEIKDMADFTDGFVVSGEKTGIETSPGSVLEAKESTRKPILIGSGATPDNLDKTFDSADGFIVGSFFKKDGVPSNLLEEERIQLFMERVHELRDRRLTLEYDNRRACA
jgi:membrane complex biogenesis BtpA family protein